MTPDELSAIHLWRETYPEHMYCTDEDVTVVERAQRGAFTITCASQLHEPVDSDTVTLPS